MSNNLFNASLASGIVTALNLKLLNLTLSNMEDTDEYNELMDTLKTSVKTENKYYHDLTNMDIHMYFDFIKGTKKFSNPADARVYLRMQDEKRIRDGSKLIGSGILLSSVISSKLTIDILKNIDIKLNNLEDNDEVNIEDIEILKMYAKRYKMHYLSSNYFIERLSLEHNYNLDKIPSYSFYDIEKKFNIQFIDKSREAFTNYVLTSIKELASLKHDDKYLVTYSSLFECARIEALLPYLNIDEVNSILHLYDDSKYRYDANGALRKVKKIIQKRKEEFSE